MQKELKATNIGKITVKIDTGAFINVTAAEGEEMSIQCSYENPNLVFEEKTVPDEFNIRIYDPDAKKRNGEILKGIFSKMKLMDIFGTFTQTLEELKALKTDEQLMEITIAVPESVKTFKTSMNNGKITIKDVKLDQLKINGNNIKAKVEGSTVITSSRFSFNNSKLKLALQSLTKNVGIEANNSEIKLLKGADFKGKIKCSGNWNKIDGKTGGDETFGIVNCETNNTKIKVAALI